MHKHTCSYILCHSLKLYLSGRLSRAMPLPESPPLGYLPCPPPLEFPPDMAEFWRLWRAEQFWHCHEALEPIWLRAQEPRKRFLNGLIHGAAATFQARRSNAECSHGVGAARQLVRARVKLEPFCPVYEQLDVKIFLDGVADEVAPLIQQLTISQRENLQVLETRLRAELPSQLVFTKSCP